MAFIDGENLLTRFQAMVEGGATPRLQPHEHDFVYNFGYVTHSQNRFVWNPSIIRDVVGGPLLRVNYYHTFTGDTQNLEQLQDDIAALRGNLNFGGGISSMTSLVPRIFKKQKSGTKTKSVDINICVDVLTQAYQTAVDDIYIVSGDGDYAPLIEQTMRTGKRVHVAALSSGLSPVMKRISDHFVDLDKIMFTNL